MTNVTSIERRNPVEGVLAALEGALSMVGEHEPHGIVIAMQSPENGLYVTYNEELGADGAITICECVKALNVSVLLGE